MAYFIEMGIANRIALCKGFRRTCSHRKATLWEERCLQLVPLGQVSACALFPANTTALLTGTFYCGYFIYFWQRSQIQIDGPVIPPEPQWACLLWICVLVLMEIKLAVAIEKLNCTTHLT